MSPITRHYVQMSERLNAAPLSSAERLRAMEIFTKELTSEQRAVVERECMKAAIDAQKYDPRRGNRATRRAKR
jgi:hypothetical protein